MSDHGNPNVESPRAPVSQRGHLVKVPPDQQAIGALVEVAIDGQEVTVPMGTTILEAAKQIGVKIPTLCYHDDLCVAGVCRICVVEIEGQRTLQAACAYPITAPITIHTHTRKVRQSRRRILDLLLSKHYGECYACFRNGNCELQSLADEYGVDFFRFGHPAAPMHEIDSSSYSVLRDMNKCILCRRCVRTCIDLQEVGVLETVHRGDKTTVSTFMDKPLAEVICINCGQCINRCPTGALGANDPTDDVWRDIDDPTKHVVIQTAPGPRAAIGECFGLPPGTPLTFEMNTALRAIGFDRVFDTNFTADLTIIEEGTELLLRLYKALVEKEPVALPQFTSCSPGLGEVPRALLPRDAPAPVLRQEPAADVRRGDQDLLRRAPQDRPGRHRHRGADAVLGEEVRVQPAGDVRLGLQGRGLRPDHPRAGADVQGSRHRPAQDAEERLRRAVRHRHRLRRDLRRHRRRDGGGAAHRCRAGVGPQGREPLRPRRHPPGSRLRGHQVRGDQDPAARDRARDPQDERRLPFDSWEWLEGATLKVAVCHGTANAKRVLEDIKAGGKFSECHFIEFMACPGGCLGGGGMPIPTSPEIRAARAKAIYAEDAAYEVRKSHENPAVLRLYDEFLTDGPCGHTAHRLLHTTYTPRGKYIA